MMPLRWTPELVEAAADLSARYGVKAVARMLGCAPDTVRHRLADAGISVCQRRWPEERVRAAAALAAQRGVKTAAHAIGVDRSTLAMAFSRAGISIRQLRAQRRQAGGASA